MEQNTSQLLLIDLSGIAHMIWHVSGEQPDPSYVGNEIVARVRALASAHPHAAVCCDGGKSFRCDIDPTYKANRDTDNRAPLKHQMDVACERLKKDGFVIWRASGFEADDIIATATAEAMKIDGATVLIASSDKDLLQLVNDRVSVKSLMDGLVRGPADVFDKFGVRPDQMGDLLALMGDTSDNIHGANKIGKVIGAQLLSAHGSLKALYEKMAHGVVAGVTLGMRTNLMEFKARWPTVAQLIALRSDVPLPFAEIAAEREAPEMEEADMRTDIAEPVPFEQGNDANDRPLAEGFLAVNLPPASAPKASGTLAGQPSVPNGADSGRTSKDPITNAGAVSRLPHSDVGALVPSAGGSGHYPAADFSQQLEPRTMPEAIQLAKHAFASRLFSSYGTPEAVLMTVLAGRELGIPAMASLRAFHIIEGKPTMSAGTIQSLVLKSKLAQYFRCSERTTERCTFVTKRGEDPEFSLTYTIDEAKTAWSKDEASWKKSGWGKHPADMLVARASSKLARLVYPDVVAGLYAPEEME